MVIYKGSKVKITTIEDAMVYWLVYRQRIDFNIPVSVFFLYIESFLKLTQLSAENKKSMKAIILDKEFNLKG